MKIKFFTTDTNSDKNLAELEQEINDFIKDKATATVNVSFVPHVNIASFNAAGYYFAQVLYED